MRFVTLWLALIAAAACDRAPTTAPETTRSGVRFLAAGDSGGFAVATEPREFVFPQDHGSHAGYRTEWWYFTGNLFDERNRHFGFELTFFRVALAPQPAARDSEWATNHAWMAHFAVTDSARGRFTAAERVAREALGLAGASAVPFRVWVEDWSASGDPTGDGGAVRLEAREGDVSIELELVPAKSPVGHGERGLDAKGPEPGNASYYYSLSRLRANGAITLSNFRAEVSGSAWMDREWSTSALSADLAGWDWFALQLSDGRDLMFYRLRRFDGSASPFSSGSLIDPQGRRRALSVDDVELEILDHWRSPKTGVSYPIEWSLTIPAEGLAVTVAPYVRNQELDLSVRYWEGAVRVVGTSSDRPIDGNGYLELAGY